MLTDGLDVELEDDVTERIDGARDGGTARVAGDADGDSPLFDDGSSSFHASPSERLGRSAGLCRCRRSCCWTGEELDEDDIPDVNCDVEGALPDGQDFAAQELLKSLDVRLVETTAHAPNSFRSLVSTSCWRC